MNQSQPKPGHPPEGALEFEITDFSEARLALDALPEGLELANSLRPGNWEAKRRPRVPSDRALVGRTMEWIATLPTHARPMKLADEAPRIANRLAEVWQDADRASACIQDLLVDRRGGRRGLAPDLRRELELLQQVLTAQRQQRR